MKELGIVEKGEVILLVHGTFWKKPGLTNTLSILELSKLERKNEKNRGITAFLLGAAAGAAALFLSKKKTGKRQRK